MKIDPNIRNITVSGRIASGTTTLAKGLANTLNWPLFEGGELFEKFFSEKRNDDSIRPDTFDIEFEENLKNNLKNKDHQIIQSHLAGFDARDISGVFKILVVCEDDGKDSVNERAKRLAHRKDVSQKQAEKEIINREEGNLKKWRHLYAQADPNWVYWDKKYYDLTLNTFTNNEEEVLELAKEAIATGSV